MQQSDLLLEHEALPAHLLDFDRNELAVGDELLAQWSSAWMLRPLPVWLGETQAAEDVCAADAEKAVRAVPRQELVSELLPQRDAAPEQVGR